MTIRLLIVSTVTITILAGAPSWGSWAQIDGATNDQELKDETNRGSRVLLAGINEIHNAMSKVDIGDRGQAVEMGSQAEVYFEDARQTFESVVARLRENPGILDDYLQNVSYDEKATAMRLAETRPPIWQMVEDAAQSGAVDLFERAVVRISVLRQRSLTFFEAVEQDDHTAIEMALLLRSVATTLEFGAYVSVIFAVPKG